MGRPHLKRLITPVLIALTTAVVAFPGAFGFSSGIMSSLPTAPDEFMQYGCASAGCHGEAHEFPAGSDEHIVWNITAANEDEAVAGNAYVAEARYEITVTLKDEQNPDAANHAGFNLRVSAGALEAVEGVSQVSADGLEATHVDAGRTDWTVAWTAPAEGVAVFDLLVNDVDGSAAPDAADQVYRRGWYISDESHAVPGAIAEEAEPHVGVELPQYWLGLIALAGMLVVMVFSFMYIRFMNPHHSDRKDR